MSLRSNLGRVATLLVLASIVMLTRPSIQSQTIGFKQKVQTVIAAVPSIVKPKQLTLDEFVSKYNEQTVDYDKNDPKLYGSFQCVDLANFYILDMFGQKPNIHNVGAGTMGKNPKLIIPDSLQYQHLIQPAPEALLPGDILFWDSSQFGHVAIYIGGGNILSQNNTGTDGYGIEARTQIIPLVTNVQSSVRIIR
jgi:NlpC/P60 family